MITRDGSRSRATTKTMSQLTRDFSLGPMTRWDFTHDTMLAVSSHTVSKERMGKSRCARTGAILTTIAGAVTTVTTPHTVSPPMAAVTTRRPGI